MRTPRLNPASSKTLPAVPAFDPGDVSLSEADRRTAKFDFVPESDQSSRRMKDKKVIEYTKKALKYLKAYKEIRARRTAKGLTSYPEDPRTGVSGFLAGNGSFALNSYIKWSRKAKLRIAELQAQNNPIVRHNPSNVSTFHSVLSLGGANLIKAAVIGVKDMDDKLRYYLGEAEKQKTRYLKCKSVRKSKGKPVYPKEPGKGPFFDDCRESYKKWKSAEKKAAQYADSLREKLEAKGQLTPEMDKHLGVIKKMPELTALDLREQDRKLLADEYLEEQGKGCGKEKDKKGKKKDANRRYDGSKCNKSPKKKKNKDGKETDADMSAQEALALADSELPPIEEYEEGASDYTMPVLLGVGAVIVVGGGLYLMSGSKKTSSEV